jgi:hypothetical protein
MLPSSAIRPFALGVQYRAFSHKRPVFNKLKASFFRRFFPQTAQIQNSFSYNTLDPALDKRLEGMHQQKFSSNLKYLALLISVAAAGLLYKFNESKAKEIA